MPRIKHREWREWRCHLFYRLVTDIEREAVFTVSAPDEDHALHVADRMLRNHKARRNANVLYSEAVSLGAM